MSSDLQLFANRLFNCLSLVSLVSTHHRAFDIEITLNKNKVYFFVSARSNYFKSIIIVCSKCNSNKFNALTLYKTKRCLHNFKMLSVSYILYDYLLLYIMQMFKYANDCSLLLSTRLIRFNDKLVYDIFAI